MSTTTTVRERPLLMSGPMVRALLSGAKTQTRRVVKPQPPPDRNRCWVEYPHGKPMALYKSFPDGGSARTGLCECPHGQPGDRLWVRETFLCAGHAERGRFVWAYRADGIEDGKAAGDAVSPLCRYPDTNTWRPSIFMPRLASRITLEITEVRVERLGDISGDDAKAEGVDCRTDLSWEGSTGTPDFYAKGYQAGFREIWESIHGKDSWDLNPWTWAISFRRLD